MRRYTKEQETEIFRWQKGLRGKDIKYAVLGKREMIKEKLNGKRILNIRVNKNLMSESMKIKVLRRIARKTFKKVDKNEFFKNSYITFNPDGFCWVCNGKGVCQHKILPLKKVKNNVINLCNVCHSQIHPWLKDIPALSNNEISTLCTEKPLEVKEHLKNKSIKDKMEILNKASEMVLSSVSHEVYKKILKKSKKIKINPHKTCEICSKQATKIHYIISFKHGGNNHINNKLYVCATCNEKLNSK